MVGYSRNSRNRYSREARDTNRLVYSLRTEGLVYPITFDGREVLPPYDDPLVITIKIAHYQDFTRK